MHIDDYHKRIKSNAHKIRCTISQGNMQCAFILPMAELLHTFWLPAIASLLEITPQQFQVGVSAGEHPSATSAESQSA